MPLPSNTYDCAVKEEAREWLEMGAPLPVNLGRAMVIGILKIATVGERDYQVRAVEFPGLLEQPWIPDDPAALHDCFRDDIHGY